MKNNFSKKLSVGTLSAAILVGSLSGCASDKNTAASDPTADGNGPDVITIYAATSGSPKPFTYIDENGVLTGHNIALLTAIFDKLPQYDLVIETTEFASIFAGLDAGRYQIAANNLVKTAEREEKYIFSDPIFKNEYVAVVALDNDALDTVSSLGDLAGLNYIGNTAVNVTTAVESYNRENPANPIVIHYTEADIVMQLRDVESGKYDFLLMDRPMYEYYNREFGLNLSALSLSEDVSSSVMSEPYCYFVVSKGNDQLLEDINGALAEVIAEGISTEINIQYFGKDYTPIVD